MGKRHAVLNGQLLESEKEVNLNFGDVLELLPAKFAYRYDEDPMYVQENSTNDVKKSTEIEVGWKTIEKLFIYNSVDLENRSKIASFDLDGTLIGTQSGAKFAKNESDWRILYPEIPGKLKQLQREGYKIVIFTNQRGLSLGYHSETEFKTKVERIQTTLGVPLQCYVSSGDGLFRKPLTGMWDRLGEHENGNVVVDRSNSFYVGDAAGRVENAKRKQKDHSCADRLFAANLNLKFYTPEEFFLGRPPNSEPFSLPSFDPKSTMNRDIFEPNTTRIDADKQEVIIMVGYPASGKSTFVETYLEPKG